MAASKKQHVKTVGMRDALTVGDLTVTRTGVEVTQKQLDELQKVAAHHGVRLEVSDSGDEDSGDDSPPTPNTTSSASSSQTGGN